VGDITYEVITAETLNGGAGLYLWTGEDDIVLNGNTYMGMYGLMQVGQLDLTEGQQDDRLAISLAVETSELLAELLNDPGPALVKVEWYISKDEGKSLIKIPREFHGKLSNPYIEDRIYTVELETIKGDVDRGRISMWSHEGQQALYPGDTCFSRCESYAQGIETRWPS